MPSQILVTHGQLVALAELDADVVITEGSPMATALDAWVCDEGSLNSDSHRSVVVDQEGNILGDETLPDQ